MRMDYTGIKSGRLTAIKPVGKEVHGAILWLCQCSCGNTIIVRGCDVKGNRAQSCGCIRKERGRKMLAQMNFKHGDHKSRLYRIFNDMKNRCNSQSDPKFYTYGGRGITICEEWLHNYRAFRDWAMSNGYRDDLTIERIDNNKGYFPDNCRWATYPEQSRNTSRNVFVAHDGKTLCLKDWSILTGIPLTTLIYRISRGMVGEGLFYKGKYKKGKVKNNERCCSYRSTLRRSRA